MPSTDELRFFDPCAATGSMFLYAQGNSVVCCHHDTLTIERRFSNHSEEVQLLAVDNQSDVGSGRFVVSYDAGQTAIVWDLMTGSEVTRFASYDALTAVAFMRNGNIAFSEFHLLLDTCCASNEFATALADQFRKRTREYHAL